MHKSAVCTGYQGNRDHEGRIHHFDQKYQPLFTAAAENIQSPSALPVNFDLRVQLHCLRSAGLDLLPPNDAI